MSERKSELRGKSWKREREERGRRQLAQRDRYVTCTNNEADEFREENQEERTTEVSDELLNNSESLVDPNLKKFANDTKTVSKEAQGPEEENFKNEQFA
ncbi:hypothetical protein X975_15019, partial [Stegodyphus mimosarum]